MDARKRRVLQGEVAHEVLQSFLFCSRNDDPVRRYTDSAGDNLAYIFNNGKIAILAEDGRGRARWSADAQDDDVLYLRAHEEGLGAAEEQPRIVKAAQLHLSSSG